MEQIVLPILDRDFVGNLIPQKFPESNIFTVNSTFQEAGLIEHMAQSVALYTGYQFFLKKEPAPTGYIGSIKSIEIFELPKLNDNLVTKVIVLQEFAGITLVDISVLLNEVEIARGQMKTVLA